MKIMLLKMMMSISSMVFTLKTPMSMGLLLMIQTIISTILMSKIMACSWMPMIIFLMMIGGLLILFMYMSSIASNEKFSFNIYYMMLIFIIITPVEEMFSETSINEKLINLNSSESVTLMKIYNKKTFIITLLLFLYLFLAMITITFIVEMHKGPLRAK
uniref:NADH dehydrogenase subunit 6 n=1 Tax=Tambocerus sp. PY-2015 TaxID=1776878 RepID=A0A0U4B922_9HEMI|nr:NADH dehydrogenase subunit 6 [Tambocerus sp. PY-2015]